MLKTNKKTIVGVINSDVLDFTVGKDPVLDMSLLNADCIGTAAHVTMLSELPLKKAFFSTSEKRAVVRELVKIMNSVSTGKFAITQEDQDVHMAVEKALTRKLGDIGRKVHTARSRNDQVAVDLKLYAKEQLLDLLDETVELCETLLKLAKTNLMVPMAGRTHMQPAMPSSVGLWASAWVEGLLDDAALLNAAYDLNNSSPLGSAASYGVPLKIDRIKTARLLGFEKPIYNVLHAGNSRGKCESVILSALSQEMLTLSRLAQDVILYSMPEFGYFILPAEYCTGSSIMPQKRNPDVLELIRAKTAAVKAYEDAVYGIVKALPSGYNRDLQETKEPFMQGICVTRASVKMMNLILKKMDINEERLIAGFTADVYAADKVLELVADGVPFRKAYDMVKNSLNRLDQADPCQAVKNKKHLGAPAGLDLKLYVNQMNGLRNKTQKNRKAFYTAITRLIGTKYPIRKGTR